MNLFFLAWNIVECARYHCDKHVVKLILEMAQMLYAAHHTLQPDDTWKEQTTPYRPTFMNHPMSVWARSATSNYEYMAGLGMALCAGYTKRYKKTHATEKQLQWLQTHQPPGLIEKKDVTLPPLCMPSYCKVKPEDPIYCYRLYYILNKSDIASYKNGVDAPTWFTDKTEWNALPKAERTRILAEKDAQDEEADIKQVAKWNRAAEKSKKEQENAKNREKKQGNKKKTGKEQGNEKKTRKEQGNEKKTRKEQGNEKKTRKEQRNEIKTGKEQGHSDNATKATKTTKTKPATRKRKRDRSTSSIESDLDSAPDTDSQLIRN